MKSDKFNIVLKIRLSTLKKIFSRSFTFLLIVIWIFSGWLQIWNFPPTIQRAEAASVSAVAGTTSSAADTSYASLDCSDNSNWANAGSPGNASASDNSYVSITGTAFDGSNVTDELQFSNFGFSIPNGATIDGVVVEIERYRGTGGTGTKDAHVMITTSAGAQEGDDKPNATAWASSDPNSYSVSYGASNDIWGATGGLTEAEVEGSGFGVVVCVTTTTANSTLFIDALRITVHYTPNASPTLTVSQPDGTDDTVDEGASYNITYDLSDSDSVATVDFYYDSDSSGLDGTLITGCQDQAEGAGATCAWDTSGMTAGTYYIYGVATDSVNSDVTDYSPGQITINASASLTFSVTTDTFPNITPSTPRFATSTLSVDTDNSAGWNVTLSRDDADTTLDLTTEATTNITDQTAWVPGADTAQAGNAVRMSLLDSSGDVLAFRVMTASGTASFISTAWWGNVDAYSDNASSFWAGLPSSGQQIGNSSVDSGGVPVLNTLLYYLDVPTTQKTGTYDGSITFTATMN